MPGFRPLIGDEPQRLMGACKGPWAAQEAAFYALLAWTGLKPREALLLRFHDVYRRTAIVERISAADAVPGDTYLLVKLGDRSVILGEEVRSALRKWVDVASAMGRLRLDRPLFFHPVCRDQTWSLNYLWRQFRTTAERAGLTGRLSLHSLSKTFVVDYAGRTNMAFAKVKVATGYDTRRNARRAYANAIQALLSSTPEFFSAEGGVQGRLARVEPAALTTEALASKHFPTPRYVRR